MTLINNFKKQADILNQRFYLLLEDFEKTFLLFKENERYQLNKKKFQQATDQLQNFYKDIVLFDNKIENKTNSSISSIKDDKNKNKILKRENDFLTSKLRRLESGDTTSEQMYDDTKVIYVQQIIRLSIIILGLVVLLIFLYLVVMEEPYTFGGKRRLFSRMVSEIFLLSRSILAIWRMLRKFVSTC